MPNSKNPTSEPQQQFYESVLQALKDLRKPEKLGKNALATPYLLTDYLPPESDPTDTKTLGGALAKMLRAVRDLHTKPKLSPDSQRILEETFNGLSHKKTMLNISRSHYGRRKKQAIEMLAAQILQHLKLPLRCEPPQPPLRLFGREALAEACGRALIEEKKVGLYGLSGVGKTALGGHLARLSYQPFWFTFQVGLNDHLSNLAFSLSYFLQRQLRQHNQTPSNLFAALIGSSEQVTPTIIMEYLQADLEALAANPPLLCFDEVDLLRPDEVESHAQIWAFLEELIALPGPMLFIGQHLASLNLSVIHRLEGLSTEATVALLQEANITLSDEKVARLRRYSRGNARLLLLFMTLHQVDKPLSEILAEDLPDAPSMEYLLNRVWRRLDDEAVELLRLLSVFRRSVPMDSLLDEEGVQQLKQLHLIQLDSANSLSLLPAFGEFIYKAMSMEEKQYRHLQAAKIRQSYSEITATAYHLIKGGEPDSAVNLWHQHQQNEIEQGQAQTALRLFETVTPDDLQPSTKAMLMLILGELHKLLGNYEAVAKTVRPIFRRSVLQARLKRLMGDVAELRSEYGRAMRDYQEGLEIVERLLAEKVLFHRDLGWVYKAEKNLDEAWEEAQLARYEAENLQGVVKYEQQLFAEAESYFQNALQLARHLNYQEGIGITCDYLGMTYTRWRNFSEAATYQHEAETIFRQTGRLTKLANVYTNQVLRCLLSGDNEGVIEQGKRVIALFTKLKEPDGLAAVYQNVAEAHFALGHLDEAENYALKVYAKAEQRHMPDCVRVLGEVQLARQQFVEAEKYLQQSIELSKQNQDRFLEGYAWRAMGQLWMVQSLSKQADQAFQQAIDLFTEIDLLREVKKTKALWGKL